MLHTIKNKKWLSLGCLLSLASLLFAVEGTTFDNPGPVGKSATESSLPPPLALTAPEPKAYLRIAAELEANLKEHILQKFFPAALDEKNGGFIENFSRDWKPQSSATKSIVYQSRLTWTSARAALRFPEEADLYLAQSRHGAKYLAEKMWDKKEGGFFWEVPVDGSPARELKEMYGHAFGIYALAANYQATQDTAALELAQKAFQWMEKYAHDSLHGGYFESIGPGGKPLTPNSKNVVGAQEGQKSMNTSIHILEALTELYAVWPDPLLKKRLQEMLEVCHQRFFRPPGYLIQFTDRDWKPVESPDSFGHDVETGFLMIEAADALGLEDKAPYWEAARQLVNHALLYGWDETRGGLYDLGTLNADGSVTSGLKTMKVWWVQAEQLNVLLLLHERFAKETPRYWEAFQKEWHWISSFQIDPLHGGWWADVQKEGQPVIRNKADCWTECYHQARALFNTSERLRQMANQQ
ncbi:MAG: AGE family epimerase/isomerase [Verrucomicrobiota bacterium]|nr:AGE family epimerase/isomerase [Verrucomicrobiota bacterium]